MSLVLKEISKSKKLSDRQKLSERFRTATERLMETLPTRRRKGQRKKTLVYDFKADAWDYELQDGHKTSGTHQLGDHAPVEEDGWGFDSESGRPFRYLLLLLSIAVGIFSFSMDKGVDGFHLFARTYLGPEGERSTLAKRACFGIFLVWCIRVMVKFAPQAAGSGLPEAKCILSGLPMAHCLGKRTLFAKAFGLTFALGAALPVGKEGPFVHIAGCVAQFLMKSPLFRRAGLPESEVLLAAVGVGVGTTFSAPVGGVLFGLELMMPHLYDKSAYTACFFAAVMGTVTFLILKRAFTDTQNEALFGSDIEQRELGRRDAEILFIVLCFFLGGICGILGGLFVWCHKMCTKFFNKIRGLTPKMPRRTIGGTEFTPPHRFGPSMARDMLVMAPVPLLVAVAHFYGDVLTRMDGGGLLTKLFSLEPGPEAQDWWPLACNFLAKWCLTAISLALPIPAGCVAPSLVIGALFARLAGVLMPNNWELYLAPGGSRQGMEARLAIVCACAFCGSVCRLFSVVVTVFELIAVPRLILPLALANLAANYMGSLIMPSIFDSILILKKIPAMPTMIASNRSRWAVTAGLRHELMEFAVPRAATDADFERLFSLIQEFEENGKGVPRVLPIIERTAENEMIMCGSVHVVHLPLIHQKLQTSRKGATTMETKTSLESTLTTAPVVNTDVLQIAAANKLLFQPLSCDCETTLKQAWIDMQASQHREGVLMIVENGILIGILTQDDLLQLGSKVAA